MAKSFEAGKMRFKDKVKNGYHKFSDGTSMHGFTELYYAKTIFWTTFWVVVIGAAVGVTGYQVVKATTQFIEQGTNTAINPAKSDDIVYPPLKICYPHWLYWADFGKASVLGLTKDAVLVSLSYLTQIFSSAKFNETMAENQFYSFYSYNKFDSIRSYFKAIAENDPFATYLSISSSNFVEINNRLIYCVYLDDDRIRSTLAANFGLNKKRRTSKSSILSFSGRQPSYNSLGGDFDIAELSTYYYKWSVNDNDVYSTNSSIEYWKSFIEEGFPMLVFPNSYDDNDFFAVTSDHNLYQVKIKLSVRTYKSTTRLPCEPSWKWVEPNQTCEINCFRSRYFEIEKPKYSFELAVFYENDNIESANRKSIGFLNLNQLPINNLMFTENSTATEEYVTEVFTEDPFNSNYSDIYSDIVSQCKTLCNDVNGCQVYTYDVTVTASSKRTIPAGQFEVSIQYPTENEVLVMVEQDSQSWEGFVGNVGGLLGIWTGASVLSFIQMFYLCCFASSDGCPVWFWGRGGKKEEIRLNNAIKKPRPKTVDVMKKI